jgi:hypothetical protein
MNAFADLGLRTAEGLTLYTTVEPCLMCSATAIALNLDHVAFAAPDPVFEGLSSTLESHAYAAGRTPTREFLGDALLASVAQVLPLANRVWARPGVLPRPEWLKSHLSSWSAAEELVGSGLMSALVASGALIDEVIDAMTPVLQRHAG